MDGCVLYVCFADIICIQLKYEYTLNIYITHICTYYNIVLVKILKDTQNKINKINYAIIYIFIVLRLE